ncbi:MAG: lipopolysaccharide biosynthesis protein [Candidatus Saccharibacteria bacterium]
MLRKILNSSLVRSSGLYTFTNALNAGIPFLLMPVLTRYLSTEDYGIVAMCSVMVTFIYPFTNLSADMLINRMYCEKESIDLPAFVTNYFLVLICSTAIVSLVLYLVAGPISKLMSFPGSLLWMMIALSAGQSITMIVLATFQAQVKPIQFGIYQIVLTIINAGLSIWFVVSLGMDWRGRIDAQLIAYTVVVIIGMVLLWKGKWLKFEFRKDYIKQGLSFSLPLIPHALGGIAITLMDRVFLTRMVGLEATGIYMAGLQIATVINILAESFNKAYVPWLYERLTNNIFAEKLRLVKMTYVYFVLSLIVAVCFGLVAPWFLSFFLGKGFVGCGVYVLWLAVGFAFQGMYMTVVSYVYYAKKTAPLAVITLSIVVANIGLNYLCIHSFGAIGAAYSTMASYFLRFLLVWILAARVYHMPWSLRQKNDREVLIG